MVICTSMPRFRCPDNKRVKPQKKNRKNHQYCARGCISTATNLEPISEAPPDRERLPVEKRDMGQNVWRDRARCLTCASTACMQFVHILSFFSSSVCVKERSLGSKIVSLQDLREGRL